MSLLDQEPNRSQIQAASKFINSFPNTTLALISLAAVLRNEMDDDMSADMLIQFLYSYAPFEEAQL